MTVILSSVLIVEFAVHSILRHIEEKPDIVRILNEDIPVVYSLGTQVMYALFLANMIPIVTNLLSSTRQSILVMWIMHIIFKMIIRLWAPILANKYDYFHLINRYKETYTFIQHIGIDTVYFCSVVTVYSLLMFTANHRLVDKVPYSLILSMLGYGVISLTFEDV